MRRGKSRGSGPEMVTAAEIAVFVYCREQWRLEHGLGLEPTNRAALDAGDRHHAEKAAAERVAGRALAVGRLLAVVAVVVLLLVLGAVPMMATPWIAAAAVLALVLGLLLILGGRGMR